MRVAISQPRYLPALNYLQRIAFSDRFVLLDDVQHQRRAYEHRNRLLINNTTKWLSIPIDRGNTSRPVICDMEIKGCDWLSEHKEVIRRGYASAPYYSEEVLDCLYCIPEPCLNFVDVVEGQLITTCRWLEIPYEGKLVRSSTLKSAEAGARKLADITRSLDGNIYVSGPNGRNYIDLDDFKGVSVEYHEFEYPVYDQNQAGFSPWLAWLDPMFYVGKKAVRESIMAEPKLLLK